MTPSTTAKPAAFTLVEMLMAMAVMAMIAMSLAMLATAVEESSEHTLGHGNAIQHARITLQRIERICREAHASESFPGFSVFSQQVGTYSFPDTLVVWHPAGTPANPNGLPRYNELVFFFPNPSAPNELLEVTTPGDSRTVPALAAMATWQMELAAIQNSNSNSQVVLTDMLYTAADGSGSKRGAARFQAVHWPAQQYLNFYRMGAMSWNLLPAAQGIKSKESGLAQNTCKIELLVLPSDQVGDSNKSIAPVPFFGSAAVHYLLYK